MQPLFKHGHLQILPPPKKKEPEEKAAAEEKEMLKMKEEASRSIGGGIAEPKWNKRRPGTDAYKENSQKMLGGYGRGISGRRKKLSLGYSEAAVQRNEKAGQVPFVDSNL